MTNCKLKVDNELIHSTEVLLVGDWLNGEYKGACYKWTCPTCGEIHKEYLPK